jgi:methyl coenzyme M reductase subunit D
MQNCFPRKLLKITKTLFLLRKFYFSTLDGGTRFAYHSGNLPAAAMHAPATSSAVRGRSI